MSASGIMPRPSDTTSQTPSTDSLTEHQLKLALARDLTQRHTAAVAQASLAYKNALAALEVLVSQRQFELYERLVEKAMDTYHLAVRHAQFSVAPPTSSHN